MKVYKKIYYYFCNLSNCACGDDVVQDYGVPKCESCDIYLEWKKSDKSIKEYSNDKY